MLPRVILISLSRNARKVLKDFKTEMWNGWASREKHWFILTEKCLADTWIDEMGASIVVCAYWLVTCAFQRFPHCITLNQN